MSREIFNRPFLKVLQPSSMGNIFHGKRNSHFNNISYFHSISYLFLNRKNKVLTHMSQPLVKFMFLAPYLPLCCHSESWVLKLFHYILIDMFQELKKRGRQNLQGSFSSPSIHHHARKCYFFYPFSFSLITDSFTNVLGTLEPSQDNVCTLFQCTQIWKKEIHTFAKGMNIS